MNRFNDTQLPLKFSQENGLEFGHIACWNEDQGSFQLYVFSALLQSAKLLDELWEVLNDDVAVDFQSNLTLEIESWNIYIIYLVKEKVGRELKYKVEQDKFSCRKLVFDNFSEKQWKLFTKDEQHISEFIADRLFNITIEKQQLSDEENLDSILRKDHGKLLDIINENSEKINYKPVFDKFLKRHGKED